MATIQQSHRENEHVQKNNDQRNSLKNEELVGFRDTGPRGATPPACLGGDTGPGLVVRPRHQYQSHFGGEDNRGTDLEIAFQRPHTYSQCEFRKLRDIPRLNLPASNESREISQRQKTFCIRSRAPGLGGPSAELTSRQQNEVSWLALVLRDENQRKRPSVVENN